MSTLLGLVIGLILTKALIEPLAARIGRRYIPSAVAQTLDLLDPFMPQMMAEMSAKQIEAVVRAKLERLTGESWKVDGQLQQFFEVFDPRISATKADPSRTIPESIRAFINEAD